MSGLSVKTVNFLTVSEAVRGDVGPLWQCSLPAGLEANHIEHEAHCSFTYLKVRLEAVVVDDDNCMFLSKT